MSGCIERRQHVSPMTGSTGPGQPQPHEEPYTVHMPNGSDEELLIISPRHHRNRGKMTPVPSHSQTPIQLTPLWEHVVRTQQFPPEVDTRLTFNEILERLRDPEWEVRQHALRVLIDVLPTLEPDRVDEIVKLVVPELINNLGNLAPAVRKGALDALRAYLLCSQHREDVVNNILEVGLGRQDGQDNFQTNVIAGVILSTPSFLFPSSSISKPSRETLRVAIGGLANRLVQVTHQESALRSLVKIRDTIGSEEFNEILSDLGPKMKDDFEIFCQVYAVQDSPSKKKKRKKKSKKSNNNDNNINNNNNNNNNNNDYNHAEVEAGKLSSNEVEEREGNSTIPPSRVVLETEIKFDSETAIMMTILEEKTIESDDEEMAEDENQAERDEKSASEDEGAEYLGDLPKEQWIERRKTPRRVHFGGEIVKLRTPDSDDPEMLQTQAHQTRIPLPISPVTKMPLHRSKTSTSNPCSPNLFHSKTRRRSRSASSSPKRDFYIHDGSLSPKKSILTKTNHQFGIFDSQPMNRRKSKSLEDEKFLNGELDHVFGIREHDRSWSFEVFEDIDEHDIFEQPAAPEVLISKKTKKVKKSKKSNSAGDKPKPKSKAQANNDSNQFQDFREKSNEINCKDDSIEGNVDALNSGNNRLGSSTSIINEVEKWSGEEMVNKKEKNSRNFVRRPSTTPGLIETVNSSPANETKSRKSKNRSASPQKLVYETFPKQERNYILMELSSPAKTKSASREVSPEVRESSVSSPRRISNDSGLVGEVNASNEPSKFEETLIIEPEIQNSGTDRNVQEEVKKSEKVDDSSDSRNGSSDSEPKIVEPNWEELGLVDQEVLDDLHNKDDWRARVRGLERVASALRTSSALIAIEPRLGSLLQAVLGGERSCKVAAAGMGVARVVVAGVSEDSLRRRLPQVAWGLTRQGGPNAAQLARIAMLRLRPALFLEQLLQPHCIDARNAKTRENALQLLIFSLVTFPSTEFKVENVANKVALMVGDRRRRVRQAALDTLAVLAQIYEPEEVLQAGHRAAKQLNEGIDMVSAIRARLARKSLPLVSADGLVIYGLQISPTVQIAAGPDVDWIVAGSGSVSPGTGRARGQLISTNAKTGLTNNQKPHSAKSPATKYPNFVTLGVGLSGKNDRPVSWQLVPPSGQEENHLSLRTGEEYRNDSPISNAETSSIKSRFEETFSPFLSRVDNVEAAYGVERVNSSLLRNDKDVIMKQRKTEENFHRRMDEIYAERSHDVTRLESRIPVPQLRDREIVIRHSTAYQRRKREEERNQRSSAPHTSAGLRDTPNNESDIARRYRSDRLRVTSRPESEERVGFDHQRESPVREAISGSSNHNRRRRSVIQTTVEYQKPPDSPAVDSRRNSAASSLLLLQKSPRSARKSSTPSVLGDKKEIDEEELNEKNRRHVSAQANPYRIQDLSDQSTQCPGRDQVPYEVSSSSSNSSVGDQPALNTETRIQDVSDEEIQPRNSFGEKSFDVITENTNPSRRNSIDQVAVSVLSSDSADLEKETSSDDVQSRHDNDSDDKDEQGVPDSSSSVVSNETSSTESMTRIINSSPHDNKTEARAVDENDGPDISMAFDRGYSNELKIDIESRVRASIYPDQKTHFQPSDFREQSQEDTTENGRKSSSAVNSVSIVVASRPHSQATSEFREAAFQPFNCCEPQDETQGGTASGPIFHVSRTFQEDDSNEAVTVAMNQSFTELPENSEIRVVTISKLHRGVAPPNENGLAQEIARTHESEVTRRLPSRVPKSRIKPRIGANKVTPLAQTHHHTDKTPGRSKPAIQQCFTQLESSEWEMVVKGLKALSVITVQHPAQLDVCPPGVLGRLLGQHIRNLRSQVSRTACFAAGDVFESRTRCLDQDLDDIAGPLLHRTADTNKFLRADSNAALDRMVEHISPHKTVAVIVHRGASHQNAVVRAAAARLLFTVVDRVGPDLLMTLPRDVRDKLLSSGAKLLMDGNLDARNYAKKIFKRLSKWDGFRRALTDSVPETTLRHIEKTLRSL